MDEPNSFNELFCRAEAGGYRMASFYEDDAGFWYCSWRRGDTVSKTVKRRLPFNAAIDAFLALQTESEKAENEAGAESDLFG